MRIEDLCLYMVKKARLNPTTRNDRIILHIMCFLVIGSMYKNGIISEDITIITKCDGPFIPAVEKWCNQVQSVVY